jgi:hypothetical protein
MMMDYATAMETLRREGYEVRLEMVGGEPLEVIPLDAVFRLCDLTGTPKATRFKGALQKQFCCEQ